LGDEDVFEQITLWQAMLVVLETGEHCPHHYYGRSLLTRTRSRIYRYIHKET